MKRRSGYQSDALLTCRRLPAMTGRGKFVVGIATLACLLCFQTARATTQVGASQMGVPTAQEPLGAMEMSLAGQGAVERVPPWAEGEATNEDKVAVGVARKGAPASAISVWNVPPLPPMDFGPDSIQFKSKDRKNAP